MTPSCHDLNSVPQLTQKLSLPHVVLLGKNIKPSPVLELPECIIYVASIELNIFWTTKLLPLLSMLLFSAGFSIVLSYGYTSGKNISKLRLIQNFACRIILGIKKFVHVSAARQSLGWRGVRQKLLLITVTMVISVEQSRYRLIFAIYFMTDLVCRGATLETCHS